MTLYDNYLTDERNDRIREDARKQRLIQEAKQARPARRTLFQRLARLTNRMNQPERSQDNTRSSGDARHKQDTSPNRTKRHQPKRAAI